MTSVMHMKILVCESLENIFGKGEIAACQNSLLFSLCLQKNFLEGLLNSRLSGKEFILIVLEKRRL